MLIDAGDTKEWHQWDTRVNTDEENSENMSERTKVPQMLFLKVTQGRTNELVLVGMVMIWI